MSGMRSSAVYEGTIRHRRFAVRGHEFRHRVAFAYLDLDEVGVSGPSRLPGCSRFRRRDHLGDPAIPLTDAVRGVVKTRTGVTLVPGPVRVLTLLSRFGHCFNPVSFYYCFSADDTLDAVVAEVTSTPWAERHAYVLTRSGPGSNSGSGSGSGGAVLRGEFDKRLHVSPFMAMDQRYTWHMSVPGPTLSVHIASHEHGRPVFDATLALKRTPLSRVSLARVTPPGRVLALIYGHALALRLKGVPVHPRPEVAA